jgi:hypothetical protein
MFNLHRRAIVLALASLALVLLHGSRAMADTKELSVLLVIDTNAGKVAGDIEVHRLFAERNLNMTKTLIDDVYASEWPKFKGRLYVDVLKGDDVSPAKIRHYYTQRLAYEKDRALLFYYCGHGAIDSTKGHWFATSGGKITRSEVYRLMNDLGPSALFLLSDCCSSYVDMGQPTLQAAQGGQSAANSKAFYNLFYQTQGVVDFTAASRGQLGFMGLFTTALTETLYQPSSAIRYDGQDGAVSWRDYIGRVQNLTESLFKDMKATAPADHASKQQQTQKPEAFGVGAFPTQYRKQLVFHNKSNKTLRVWVQYYDLNLNTNQWQWYRPTENGLLYTLKPGQKTPLLDGDRLICANAVHYWTATEDGSEVDAKYKTELLRLAPQSGYQGPLQQLVVPIG